MSPYANDLEVKNALGIESWRNLSKETFFRFLESLPEIDRELALKLIAQIPEITKLARAVLNDATKAYDAALKSNARSLEMVQEINRGHLEALKAELGKDLTPEERLRVLDHMREVRLDALAMHRENQTWIERLHDKKLAAAGLTTLAVVAYVLAARSGGKPPLGAGRVVSA